MSLEALRKTAELNLCEDCYKRYLMLIEPTVQNLLQSPLDSWRKVESYVTMITMKVYGAFKGRLLLEKLDVEDLPEEFRNEFDIKRYKEVKKWRFRDRINYLHKEGILQDFAYRFLCKAGNIRNRIHDPKELFSEQDYSMFNNALAIIFQIHLAVIVFDQSEETENLKSSAEKLAEHLLI